MRGRLSSSFALSCAFAAAISALGACNALVRTGTDHGAGDDGGAGDDADAPEDAAAPDDAPSGPQADASPPRAVTTIKSVEVVPVYLGPWDPVDVAKEQAYLAGFAQYLTGGNAKRATQPLFAQYGVTSAIVRDPVLVPASADVALDRAAMLDALHAAQASQPSAAYAPNRVILVRPSAKTMIAGDCAYHGAEGVDRYYAVSSRGCDPLAVPRTLVQSAIDPSALTSIDHDDKGKPCSGAILLWFGTIPLLYDKSLKVCSVTGYDDTDEPLAPGYFTATWTTSNDPQIQINGASFTAFKAKAEELANAGWRFVVAQPYTFQGNVLYNGVWRPGTGDERAFHELTPDALGAKDDELAKQGFRLKIVEPYVLADEVRYTAVWNRGTESETRFVGEPAASFPSKYAALKAAGQRLKLIRAYELAGQTYYTAVLHPSADDEDMLYAATEDDYRAKYAILWDQGWRLKVFQPFVQAGNVVYTCVWRHEVEAEKQYWNSENVYYRAEDDAELGYGRRVRIMAAVPQAESSP